MRCGSAIVDFYIDFISFPDEDAVMKLLYLRVKELYSRWGEGCHQPGWARVRNQLLCDEGIRARIERFL